MAVPMFHRRFLSPVSVRSSLGREPNSNPYTTYRTMAGDFALSRSSRAHALYTGTIGAFLDRETVQTWYHDTLPNAALWLRRHNPLLRQFVSTSEMALRDNAPRPLPTAMEIHAHHVIGGVSREEERSEAGRAIVVPYDDFPEETHDEDNAFARLMIGFVHPLNSTTMPILYVF